MSGMPRPAPLTRAALAALAVSIVLPLLVVGPVAEAGAATGGVRARVTSVEDGDTIYVDRNFDGKADARVRLVGFDAPEHTLPCNFNAANRALKSLLRHRVVRLVSKSGRTGIQHRIIRRVLVPVGGTEIDVAQWMLERGWGVWMPRGFEPEYSRRYHRAADTAAKAGLGWFNEERCGAGPGAKGALSMHVQWASDVAASMSLNARRNEEFIRISNRSAEPVNIDGWTLRVGNHRNGRVPPGGAIAPGSALEVHVGVGTNTVTDRYLNSSVPMLQDTLLDGGPYLGTGSYLIDPDGDIRAWMTWPCIVACADPTGGALTISQVVADPPGLDTEHLNGEVVRLTNSGSVPIRIGDFVMESSPYQVEFPDALSLESGASIEIRSGAGSSDGQVRYLGAANPVLNPVDRVVLRTMDGIVIDCVSWGGRNCPPGS